MCFFEIKKKIDQNKTSLVSNTNSLIELLEKISHPDPDPKKEIYSSPYHYNNMEQQDVLHFFMDLLVFLAPKRFRDSFKILVTIFFLIAIMKIKIH